MNQKLFSKDFTLVVIGQVISLFGNATIRFALPLYLLNLTGSSALYGTVTACAFIPAILLSPVGGIVADRVNKRNIMVILDFFTAAVILAFSLLMNEVNLVLLLTVTLSFLYGIAGAYQPSVQASIPALTNQDNFMAANSIINTISSFSSLMGPVLGGILYSAYGLKPVLWVCTVCFMMSAVMEIFIKIPFQKQTSNGGILKTARADFAESIRFIQKGKPVIGKTVLAICGINLFLAAMIIVALPYLVTEVLNLDASQANRLYGFAQGALAAGGLAGGIGAGIFANKLAIYKSGNLLTACAACVFPISVSLMLFSSAIFNYIVITVCCFAIMVCSTIFTVQMMSFIQTETPQNLIGKVVAVILTISMCAQPLGNALYGVLFEICQGFEYAVVLFSGIVSLMIAISTKHIFKRFSADYTEGPGCDEKCKMDIESCMIREITKNDLDGLLKLYMQLHNNPMPEKTAELLQIWDTIFQDKNHHVIVAEENGKIISSCICVIIPNLTHNQQPYAFIENVVTDEKFRKRGLATQCLDYAKEIALKENCYKMMLLTGSKKKSTLDFYKKAGYNSDDKTGFIQWI